MCFSLVHGGFHVCKSCSPKGVLYSVTLCVFKIQCTFYESIRYIRKVWKPYSLMGFPNRHTPRQPAPQLGVIMCFPVTAFLPGVPTIMTPSSRD